MDLLALEKIIKQRYESGSADSYTVQLMNQGVERIGKKFGEEAVEALIEGIQGNKELLVSESVDMLYHWLLLLRINGVEISEIYDYIDKKHQENL